MGVRGVDDDERDPWVGADVALLRAADGGVEADLAVDDVHPHDRRVERAVGAHVGEDADERVVGDECQLLLGQGHLGARLSS